MDTGRLILRILRKQPQRSPVRRQLCYSRDSIGFMASLAFADELEHSPVCKPRPWTGVVHALDIRLHRPVAGPSSPGSNPTMHDTCAASRIYQELSQSVRLSSQQVHGGRSLPQHQGMARATTIVSEYRILLRLFSSCPGFLAYEPTADRDSKGLYDLAYAKPGSP